ncbi:MAG: ERAP1-like C-terminal domain-containing protein [Chloroflexi bacterium]|nr:ERAP1-like C-terminal domain-containing protein [Chloroflexota bacterium]
MRGLLDGSATFEGLAVDTDLRWHIVHALAAAGAAGEELIDAELARDSTDQGQRHAAAARAAQPAVEAKAHAWAAITQDTTLPLATLRAIMRGFQQYKQRPLLEPYVGRYFDALEPTWRERGMEVGLAFTEETYPRTVVDQTLVQATEAYLAAHAPAPPIRRLLLEGQDEIRRALRARARDATVTSVG